MLTLDEVMEILKNEGTAQNRKVYGCHGVMPPLYGVSYAALGKLKKKIKIDHVLATELWASGIHDARILACMVADPTTLTLAQTNAWTKELGNYTLVDAFAGLVARSPHAESRMKMWMKSKNEWINSAGWSILSSVSITNEELSDEYFLPYIGAIEFKIHNAHNRARHTMNNSLIAIGVRSEALARKATEAARRIGIVAVDHGETSCKTPDAAAYIKKTRDHYAKKGTPVRGWRRKSC